MNITRRIKDYGHEDGTAVHIQSRRLTGRVLHLCVWDKSRWWVCPPILLKDKAHVIRFIKSARSGALTAARNAFLDGADLDAVADHIYEGIR